MTRGLGHLAAPPIPRQLAKGKISGACFEVLDNIDRFSDRATVGTDVSRSAEVREAALREAYQISLRTLGAVQRLRGVRPAPKGDLARAAQELIKVAGLLDRSRRGGRIGDRTRRAIMGAHFDAAGVAFCHCFRAARRGR